MAAIDTADFGPLIALLHETKLADLAPRKPSIVEIAATSNLSDAFTALIGNRVTSAPVYDERVGKYTGFLDIRDLVSFIVHYGKHITEGNLVVADLCAAGSGSVLDNVTVTYLSRRNPFRSVKAGADMLDAIKILGGGAVKRVAVLNAAGRVANIVSQSDVISFLAKHIALFPEDVRATPVSELFHSEFKPVISVATTDTVLGALTKMDNSKITGIGIVDGDRLVGNVSGKDLKLFTRGTPSYAMLHEPVMEMIKDLRQREMVDISIPVIAIFPGTAFEIAVRKIAATKVHRVYVVDSEERFAPVGIVSQTAVLKRIAAIDALH
eukprot:c4458_g1_i2.p2 GENE.c4458_g1_i2~~c4458_g1_i2.p2  ORF type:complete len:324 (+),score=84.10 c4458_g1_i2:35-1006(+)